MDDRDGKLSTPESERERQHKANDAMPPSKQRLPKTHTHTPTHTHTQMYTDAGELAQDTTALTHINARQAGADQCNGRSARR